ncbi:hypothetical protein U1Q18_047374 [Sarracenia purpurea var. burkii]
MHRITSGDATRSSRIDAETGEEGKEQNGRRQPALWSFFFYQSSPKCEKGKDNVSNQREHVVHLLANEQTRLGIPDDIEPMEEIFESDRFTQNLKLDEAAVQKVFVKSLDNYIKWCYYLGIQPVWSNLDAVSKEKKLLFISLYFLIWGEAANIRFIPECLCYIFHHLLRNLVAVWECISMRFMSTFIDVSFILLMLTSMVRELDEIVRQQIAKPADSCKTENGVSFHDQVICPLYEVVAAAKAYFGDEFWLERTLKLYVDIRLRKGWRIRYVNCLSDLNQADQEIVNRE